MAVGWPQNVRTTNRKVGRAVANEDVLTSWKDGESKEAILGFVRSVTEEGPHFVPPSERIATFDNDGTLWCEKPMPIQLDFILRRLYAMAEAQPELRDRQPWKAAHERDYAWLGDVIDKHYAGDESGVQVLGAGVLAAYDGMSVDDFEARSEEFLRTTQHPTLGRGYLQCAYTPMVELLTYLQGNGFTNYIASGGGRDFMRPISEEVYGIPRERVIGSSSMLAYTSDGQGWHDHPHRGSGISRRRPAEADPYLEPHRPAPAVRRGQLERGYPHAGVRVSRGATIDAIARAPRRRRAGVRVHERC